MNQINKQPQELDRWENEGGALPAEKMNDGAPVGFPEKALQPLAGRKAVQAKIGPARRAAHDRFFADLMDEPVNVPEPLEATGDHGEARTESAARGGDGPDETALCRSHEIQSRF